MLIAVLLSVASLAGSDPDGVVSTAPATPAALDATDRPDAPSPQAAVRAQAVDPHGLTTDQQIQRWMSAPPRDSGAPTWVDHKRAPLDDREVHGEFNAGIGTGGYRQYGGTVSMPIGSSARLDLSYEKIENAPWSLYRGDYGNPFYNHPFNDRGGYAGFEGGYRERVTAEYESAPARSGSQ